MKPNLIQAILRLRPSAVPAIDFNVQPVDGVPSVVYWSVGKLGEQPSPAEIASAITAGHREAIASRIAARRWEVETGGVTINGMRVATDDRSKFLLREAADAAVANPNYVAEWKAAPGVWVNLGIAELTGLKTAVFAHVTACFAREKELSVQLANTADADLDAFAEVVEAFWPQT